MNSKESCRNYMFYIKYKNYKINPNIIYYDKHQINIHYELSKQCADFMSPKDWDDFYGVTRNSPKLYIVDLERKIL